MASTSARFGVSGSNYIDTSILPADIRKLCSDFKTAVENMTPEMAEWLLFGPPIMDPRRRLEAGVPSG